jgi:hypothetical protein
MANDWTRLLQEASRRGGPEAMRAFYSNRGKLQGAGAMLLLVGSITLAVKAAENFTKAKEVDSEAPKRAAEEGGETAPGDPTSEDDSEAPGQA